jgi:hypothetical protein
VTEDLRSRSYAALLTGAREVSPVPYDSRGYALRFEDNVMDGLSLQSIAGDIALGAGCELDGKIRAAHSSTALVVNTFGPWRTDSSGLVIAGMTGFDSLRFEVACPTGLRGTPPHLDLLADGKTPVAIEPKCTEWMEAKPAEFAASYDRLRSSHGQA